LTTTLLTALGKSFLFVLATILPILNPAATAPIFLGLTENASASTRALLARRIARNMFALMVGPMLVGSYVLEFFGISLPIVRVGGGLIVAAAWRLLNATQSSVDSRTELAEAFTPEQARKQVFYPLTFPSCCAWACKLCGMAPVSCSGVCCCQLRCIELSLAVDARPPAGPKNPR